MKKIKRDADVSFTEVDIRVTFIEKRVCRSNGHMLLLHVIKAPSVNLCEWVI